MSNLLRALLGLALLLQLNSCRPPQGDMMGGESGLKWGHLRYEQASGGNWLTNIGPQDQVELCGDAPEKLEIAVRKWADAIGRGKHMKFAQCNQANAGKKIKLTLRLNFAEYPCTINGVQGATTPNDGVIRVCSRLAAPEAYVILHEVGHMWGMCDMYPGQTQNCDPNNMTQIDNSAIMGNGSIKDNPDLSPDDRDGVIAMAARPDFASVKKAWDDFLATNPSPSGEGPMPPTAATSGIYMALDLPDASGNSLVWLATPPQVSLVTLCKGDKTVCGPGKPGEGYTFQRNNLTVSARNFFKSTTSIPLGNYTGKMTLLGYDGFNNLVESTVVEIRRKP